jgi:AraC-like DNA-binding protein
MSTTPSSGVRGRSPVRGQAPLIGASWRREAHTYVLDSVDTPERVPEPFSILAEVETAPVPVEFPRHTHALHELAWVRGGTMTTRVEDQLFTVPPGHGLWIPAGVEHSGRMTAHTQLCDALFDPARCPVSFARPTAVLMTGLLESLLTHLSAQHLGRDERLRAEAVVFDVLTPTTNVRLDLPTSSLLEPVVAALLENPGDQRSVAEWGQALGVSERTVSRAFRSETGLSMVQWRQALRVHAALTLISEGMQVQEVSERLGYAQPSTFIASFKRVVGLTPGAYLAQD